MRSTLGLALLSLGVAACQATHPDEVRSLAHAAGVVELAAIDEARPEQIELGRMLFFDPLLSGNKDISCSTCHHPFEALGDGRSLPVGTAAVGDIERRPGPDHRLIPRNAPALFDAGNPHVTALFWDARIQQIGDEAVMYDDGPEASKGVRTVVPEGLDSLLATQVLFPLADRDEMKGDSGEYDIFGELNELATIADADFESLWRAIVRRIVETEGYVPFLSAAYPDQAPEAFEVVQLANSLAAFITAAYRTQVTPFDGFMQGEDEAMSAQAIEGAALFFGEAQCSVCHNGPLLSDEGLYNIGVPPIGRGPTREIHVDTGAALRTHGGWRELFHFKTPRLRHVADSGPWMHNGAYTSLEDVIRHHLNPIEALEAYEGAGLTDDVAVEVHRNPGVLSQVSRTLSDEIQILPVLTTAEIRAIVAFLEHLSGDVSAIEASIPSVLPSALPLVEP